jgi:tetratricopeptide (TPR) repeat protein
MSYVVAAGDQASRAYATAEAIAFYNRALELQQSTADPAVVRRAYEGLGDALNFANRIPEAEQTYQQLLGLGERTADLLMQISALNRLATLAALHRGDFREAESLLARGETLAGQHGEIFGVVDRTLLRCQMCTVQGDFEGAAAHMGGVVALGEEAGTPEQMVLGLEHVSSSLTYLLRFDEARSQAAKGLALAREIGDLHHAAGFIWSLAYSAICDGDFPAARAMLQEALAISQHINAADSQAVTAWMLATLASWQGEYEQALGYAHQALDAARPLEPYTPYLMTPLLGLLDLLYVEIGGPFQDQSRQFREQALRLLENPVAAITGGTAWADIGFSALALGDLELAGDVFQKGLNYPTMFMLLERARLLTGAALLASARGELDEAASLIQTARSYVDEQQLRHVMPLVALAAGRIYTACADAAFALEAFTEAEGAAQALGLRPILWQARAGAAVALATLGRKDEAVVKRAEAQAMIGEIAGLFRDDALRAGYLQSAQAGIT